MGVTAVGVWNFVLPNGKGLLGQEECVRENRCDKTTQCVSLHEVEVVGLVDSVAAVMMQG
jgi:hypothetical protein